MAFRSSWLSLTGAALLVAAGCSKAPPQTGGGGDQPTTGLKPQSGPSVTYTPPGCNYSITTPTADSAEVGGTVAATQPPDHVHAAFASDPSSSFAVNWRSEDSATLTQLFYGTDQNAVSSATAASGSVKMQEGHSLTFAGTLDTGTSTRVHEVHVCGLQPATTYYYKVGNTGAFSKVFALTTAPAVGSTSAIRFGITGDSRDSPDVFAKIQKAIADAGASFQLFTGDAVLIGEAQTYWNKFFEATYNGTSVSDVLATIPMQFANGNHEGLSINYLAQFPIPDLSSAAGSDPKQWYSFDYGNIHFVVLNDTTSSDSVITGVETTWLDSDLAGVDRTKTPWIFVFHHKPAFSCSPTHGSDTLVRQTWQPLFDKYKVDVVFNGHEHNYERSKPIRGLQSNGQANLADSTGNDLPVNGSGTLYYVAGGAGASFYPTTPTSSDCNYRSISESMKYYYLIVDVQAAHLKITTYRVDDGSTLETVEYSKG